MKERKARSILTILGIAVGIAAIVALLAIGYGMEAAVTGELSEMADLIMVALGSRAWLCCPRRLHRARCQRC